MSKMPALSRSFHRVSLKTFSSSALFGSCVEALKSGTADRTISTSRPVPVRIQSYWAQVGRLSNRSKAMVQLRNSFMNYFSELARPEREQAVSIFCNRTRTRRKPYFPNNPTVVDQKYQCAGWLEPLIDPTKALHSIAQPARWQAARLGQRRR